MTTWNFNKESNTDSAGANTIAGQYAGNQPHYDADVLASKRNVIATDIGWVRRTIKHTARVIDEPLVPAHPGGSDAYPSANYLGFPDIAQMYLGNSTVESLSASQLSTIPTGSSMNLYVVFNEPVKHDGATGVGNAAITFSNTAAGQNDLIAVATADNSNTGIVNANNTLVFSFVAGTAGNYKVAAGSIGAQTTPAVDLVSLNTGNESANLVITGAVSNTLGTFTIV